MSAGSDTLHLAYVSEEVVGDTNDSNAINPTQNKPQDGETEILDESLHIVEPSTSTIQNGLSQSTSAQSMPPSNDVRPKKKPPRRATAESPNVCFECKTTDSKLWRRGPDGQLMCNACGLRWRRSNKAREAPKATPKKRKLTSTSSHSPQSPQPMSLPQSSMMAAQRGGLLGHTFSTNSNIYAALPGSNPSFGQLQYQPQNMYLHQQQLALQAQFRPLTQQIESTAKRSDAREPQIDPALMPKRHAGISRTDHEIQRQTQTTTKHNISPMLSRNISEDNSDHNNLRHLTIGDPTTLERVTHVQPGELAHTKNQALSLDPGKFNHDVSQAQDSSALHDMNILSSTDTTQAQLGSDTAQSEDFSGLLHLKAFVDG